MRCQATHVVVSSRRKGPCLSPSRYHVLTVTLPTSPLPTSSLFHLSSFNTRLFSPPVVSCILPSIHQYVHPSIHPSIRPFIYPSINTSIHLSVRSSGLLSVCSYTHSYSQKHKLKQPHICKHSYIHLHIHIPIHTDTDTYTYAYTQVHVFSLSIHILSIYLSRSPPSDYLIEALFFSHVPCVPLP